MEIIPFLVSPYCFGIANQWDDIIVKYIEKIF
jgi:hypothetical protein